MVDCPTQLQEAATHAFSASATPDKGLLLQKQQEAAQQGGPKPTPIIITIRRGSSSGGSGSGRKLSEAPAAAAGGAGAAGAGGVGVGAAAAAAAAGGSGGTVRAAAVLGEPLVPRALQQQGGAPRVFEIKHSVASCFTMCEAS